MWEAMRNLVALNREVMVSAVGNNLEHSSFKFLYDLHRLLSIMHCSHSSICILLLNLSLVLLERNVRQLDVVRCMMLLWQLVPNE